MNLGLKYLIYLIVSETAVHLLYFFVKTPFVWYFVGLVIGTATHWFMNHNFVRDSIIDMTDGTKTGLGGVAKNINYGGDRMKKHLDTI